MNTGKTVLVHRRSDYDRFGNSILVADTPEVYPITAFYEDNSVRTSSGDVWRVKPCSTAADFIVDEPTSSRR